MFSTQLKSNDTTESICIIGLGYVGLTLALTLARIGFKVLGVEKNQTVLEQLKDGKAHFYEPRIDQLLSEVINSGKFEATSQIPAHTQFDYFIVTVGTPLDSSNKPRMDMIEEAVCAITPHLQAGTTVILRSTVKLGTTRKIVKPLLDATHVSYNLAFCPERTTEGTALRELRFLPQIVSGLDNKAIDAAARLFSAVTPIVLKVSSLETAELIKMIDNTQRDLYFSYANEVAAICDEAGVSTREVIDAGNFHYPRNNLPKPGLVAGPCLSKDSYLLQDSFVNFPELTKITMAARHVNEQQVERAVDYLASHFKITSPERPPQKIAILGFAFKGTPETDDLRGSTVLGLCSELRKAFPGAELHGFDPIVPSEKIIELGVIPLSSLDSAFEMSDLLIIHNNHTLFSQLSLSDMTTKMSKNSVVYDFWNLHPDVYSVLPSNVTYVAFGEHFQNTSVSSVKGASL